MNGSSGVVTLTDIKKRNKNKIEWKYVGYKKQGETYPLKIWENLECVLEKHNILVRLNCINHEIDYLGMDSNNSDLRNGKVTDIYALQVLEGLNLSRAETENSIIRIAEKNKYNPFIDMLKENKNDNFSIIDEVFSCIEINDNFEGNKEYYETIFQKWCLNVVKMAHNTLQNDFSSQGVLVLQGGQGCFKSTFSRKLMPNKAWFKGDKSLDPEKVDSVTQNTSYILVEWGELDSTLKGEQAKLKQFITSTNDEYRSPYARFPEKYPRITSYIGTVNKKDFLKDETGSRRFWIIPVKKCNIDKLDKINMGEFWGAVYSLWLRGDLIDYLTIDEMQVLNEINKEYAFENDVTITLNEKIDWNMDHEYWKVYNITEICDYLYLKEKKQVKIELEKRGIEYKAHKLRNGRVKKGFKLPKLENDNNF